LASEVANSGFAYFGRLDALSRRLEAILERPVAEPIRKDRLRHSIEKDRIIAF
jgi:hypothetical protein